MNYAGLTPYLVKAIQDIATISGTFKANLIAWLGSATNGIANFFAGNIHATNELCVGDTCVTPQQFQAMVAASAASSGNSQPTTPPSPARTSTAAGPSLVLNGNDPATWTLNTAWQDNLGALFTYSATTTGPVTSTIYSTSTIDTTQPGTTTIDYWAQVPNGDWLHTTRDVVIQAAANNNPPPLTPGATSTATTTSR